MRPEGGIRLILCTESTARVAPCRIWILGTGSAQAFIMLLNPTHHSLSWYPALISSKIPGQHIKRDGPPVHTMRPSSLVKMILVAIAADEYCAWSKGLWRGMIFGCCPRAAHSVREARFQLNHNKVFLFVKKKKVGSQVCGNQVFCNEKQNFIFLCWQNKKYC